MNAKKKYSKKKLNFSILFPHISRVQACEYKNSLGTKKKYLLCPKMFYEVLLQHALAQHIREFYERNPDIHSGPLGNVVCIANIYCRSLLNIT